MPNWKKLITSGSDAALNSLNVTSALTASGLNYPTTDGDNGDFLFTDGAGNLSFTRSTVFANVKNVSGGTLQKGTPVHANGTAGNASEVIAASASVASTMPATYVLNETLADDAEGLAIITGYINGVDTSAFGEGDVIYVGATGSFTNVKPQGSDNLIQNLGIVNKVHASNGSGYVYGSGRSNDVPNLPEGKIWVGSSNYTVTSSIVTLDEDNSQAQITGSLSISSVVNAGTDTDKFLVLDSSGNVDFRTGANVLSDIGATTCTGTVTGTGATDRLAIWNGTSALNSHAQLTYNNSTLCILTATTVALNVDGGVCLNSGENDATVDIRGFGGSSCILMGNSEEGGICMGPNVIIGGSQNFNHLNVNQNSSILGGDCNKITANCTTIAGGTLNTGSGACGFIGGGCQNRICSSDTYSVIGGGRNNSVDASFAIIGGGDANKVCSAGSFSGIFAGASNIVHGSYSAVLSGFGNNTSTAFYTTIAGGLANSTAGANGYSFIGSGQANSNYGYYSAIVAGRQNCITNFGLYESFIGAGCCNRILGNSSSCKANFIGGGQLNLINCTFLASIVGGQCNTITSTVNPYRNVSCNAVIVAGYYNCINHSCFAFIGGGSNNCVYTGNSATISGGCNHCISTQYGFVGGGVQNRMTGAYGTIAGGRLNCITGACSGILAGFSNCVTHNHSFAIGCDLTSTADCYTFMNNACVSGTTRTTTLVETSAKKYKECILPLEDQIENIKKLEPVEFQWKKDKTRDIGFIAEDVKEVYPNLIAYEEDGEINGIQYSKLTTVLVKALQQQQKEIDNLTKKVDTLTSKLDSLQK